MSKQTPLGLVRSDQRDREGLSRAIGLMSGTSMDGIDVALIETDGDRRVSRGPALTYPYSAAMRQSLRKGLTDGAVIKDRCQRPGCLGMLERYLTDLHVEVVGQFLEDIHMKPSSIDLIGFHGHTVLHQPEHGLTVQIGDGDLLASETGIDVIFDLRGADLTVGGMGAPLVPVYHQTLVGEFELPVAIVNVGGVANVTFVGSEAREDLIAFDTGPGNALIDDWMFSTTGDKWDSDGAAAIRGTIDERVLGDLLANSFFARRPPKALDRNAFDLGLLGDLCVDDGAATLSAFTAITIAKARNFFPAEPLQWVICGGGRRNKALMAMIEERVENVVVPAEAVGLGGDSIEAEAWAYLAVRAIRGLPITFPGTTGAAMPFTGGVLARA